jgi:hypothetical protein
MITELVRKHKDILQKQNERLPNDTTKNRVWEEALP